MGRGEAAVGSARGAGAPGPIAERLRRLDWVAIERDLSEQGYAVTPVLLGPWECRDLAALYADDRRFRKHVDMERHRFGVGEYRYFRHPLPPLVRGLRTHAYGHLAPIANRLEAALGGARRFPPRHAAFLRECRARGQAQPTPLLLRYQAGGYNCLHRDLYGEVAFPLQITCLLSEPDLEFEGGSFLLVEQRPRSQSVGTAIALRQGQLVVFPVSERPSPARRGVVRATMRHGVSRVTRGVRYALGVIFHDARS
jgi:hypothetical protein